MQCEIFDLDFKRYSTAEGMNFIKKATIILKSNTLKGLWLYRKANMKNGVIQRILLALSRRLFRRDGNEIACKSIGSGFVLAHPYDITINPRAEIGDNVTLFKGATIGSIRSGDKQGVPKIGNNVVICCNAFVCGDIIISDNVLIAANSFVNFDVPSNSVVIGNPGVIHHKDNPCGDYL